MKTQRQAAFEAEFAEFVATTSTSLLRAATLMCGDQHLAEDLLQTTYAKLFSRWRKVRTADNLMGYARTTLTNTFISHARLRRNTESPTDELPEIARAEPPIEAHLDLVSALRQLCDADRAVVVARYWEDLSVAETAYALGLTETGVRTRARRALIRLRAHLEPIPNSGLNPGEAL